MSVLFVLGLIKAALGFLPFHSASFPDAHVLIKGTKTAVSSSSVPPSGLC